MEPALFAGFAFHPAFQFAQGRYVVPDNTLWDHLAAFGAHLGAHGRAIPIRSLRIPNEVLSPTRDHTLRGRLVGNALELVR